MIKLKVSENRSEELFDDVPHVLFQRNRHLWWRIREDGTVPARCVLWFFCWAFNGDHSPRAEAACKDIWRQIMPISFAEFNAKVGYDYCERFRYSEAEKFIENEVEQFLKKSKKEEA